MFIDKETQFYTYKIPNIYFATVDGRIKDKYLY